MRPSGRSQFTSWAVGAGGRQVTFYRPTSESNKQLYVGFSTHHCHMGPANCAGGSSKPLRTLFAVSRVERSLIHPCHAMNIKHVLQQANRIVFFEPDFNPV